jgi:hypothetical protein
MVSARPPGPCVRIIPHLGFDDHLPKIIPLRAAPGWSINDDGPDPRGLVLCADGRVGATVTEVWLDKSENMARYLELAVPTGDGGSRQVLLPTMLATYDTEHRQVLVASVMTFHLADAPAIAHPDQITMREEDRVAASLRRWPSLCQRRPSGARDMSAEYEIEPVPGLPGELPAGESILWQGAPVWPACSVRMFRLRLVVAWFALLLVWRVAETGADPALAGRALVVTAVMAGACVAMLSLLGWLIARATVYAITNRRLVIAPAWPCRWR